jgi:hypothetical protein
MASTTWNLAAALALALAASGTASADGERRTHEERAVSEYSRQDFLRGGRILVDVVFGPGRGRDGRRGPDPYEYPDRYPERRCGGCDYDWEDDDDDDDDDREDYREGVKRRSEWEREEAKKRAEWEREEAKKQGEWEREEAKKRAEWEREEEKRRQERHLEEEKRFRERFERGYKD